MDLLRQSSESLAGRASYLDMSTLHVLETGPAALDSLWIRGGFPESLLAPSDGASLRWRQDFVRTYLERDIPQLAPRIPAETLRRFMTMVAHSQGGLLNLSAFGRGLGVDSKTCGRYLDLLVDLLLVRRLEPWHANVGKRLVRSPRIYLRDSGLVHSLLGLPDREAVLGHPVAGASWEGMVVETLTHLLPDGATSWFYRTAAGAEVDLLLMFPPGRTWAVAVKRSLSPQVARGFHQACEDIQPERSFVVYPGAERYPLSSSLEAISLPDLAALVLSTHEPGSPA
jgi:predicted AAA+ superfamily ATPase